MDDTIQHFRERALNSTYSTDREAAIEQLGALYPESEEAGRRAILRTYAEIARESSHADDRRLAKNWLLDLYDDDPRGVARTVVTTFCRIALEAKLSDERRDALDRLRHLAVTGVPDSLEDRIRETFLEAAEESSYTDERRRARDGLAELFGADVFGDGPLRDELDVDVEIGETSASDGDSTDSVSDADSPAPASTAESESTTTYLGVSLAEHLKNARSDAPEDCLQRAEELASFVEGTPVQDPGYEAVLDDVTSLVEQLEVVADTRDELDEDRQVRVERVATAVEKLYLRSSR